ncbi:MAG: YqcI/YcgG family protein [Pseudomonadota bacterium]
MTEILSKTEVSKLYSDPCWQRVVFSEFEATLDSRSRPFPCVFGVAGFRKDEVRFAFVDKLTADSLSGVLKDYLAQARSFGTYTSLVVFSRPGPVKNLESYRRDFWGLLDDLEAIDDTPRPADIPEALDTDHWEFCFAGEPIFVVCNTPANILRQSRRSTSFMVTFQPRWVFDGILGTDDPAMHRALATVRERLADFDAIEPAPYLGEYGKPGNREYQQYFIDDTNAAPQCPYHALGQRSVEEKTKKGKVA